MDSPQSDSLPPPGATRRFRKIVVFVFGATLIVLGVVLVFLPGPGLLTVAAGVGVLGTEFVWARAWLARLRRAFTGGSGAQGGR